MTRVSESCPTRSDVSSLPKGIDEFTSEVEAAWNICSELFCEAVRAKTPPQIRDVNREILFCLLGGFGVTYELNRSATDILDFLDPFSSTRTDDELLEALISQLNQPIFEPRRTNGQLRRYRYPYRKAELIVQARAWIVSEFSLEKLFEFPGSIERREWLSNCPGIGFKTASWILRNLGCGDDLAIIDIHLARALVRANKVSNINISTDYELAEKAFLLWCKELAAPPAAFDLFLWEWQRGSLQPQ